MSGSPGIFEVPQQLTGSIRGSVVDYEDFLFQPYCLDAEQHLLNIGEFVINGNDNRDRHAEGNSPDPNTPLPSFTRTS